MQILELSDKLHRRSGGSGPVPDLFVRLLQCDVDVAKLQLRPAYADGASPELRGLIQQDPDTVWIPCRYVTFGLFQAHEGKGEAMDFFLQVKVRLLQCF